MSNYALEFACADEKSALYSMHRADYFKNKGYDVYVLNRNTKKQLDGVKLICADRNELKDSLKVYHFDAVLDICAYNRSDIQNLTAALNPVDDYIMISSSAVYPETNPQPFREEQPIGPNSIWGAYGTNKVEAEQYFIEKYPNAYILRPPYLYGPMQNIYREAFVFDCALQNRKFYIPKDGRMKLQFFHVEDLCKMMERILEKHPEEHIYNVGNNEAVDINTFVELCYEIAGREPEKVYVKDQENQRAYFCFHDYEYYLDVTRQKALLPETKNLRNGLRESLEWYMKHPDEVRKKDYIQYIDEEIEN